MTPQEFQQATLVQLEESTGINRFMWCRYLRGKSKITEKTLNKAAEALGWSSDMVLRELNTKRQSKAIA